MFRALVAGVVLAALVAPTSAWAGPTMAEECHGCCPEVIRAAALPDCCVMAPASSTAPLPVRINSVAPAAPEAVPTVIAWAQPPAPADPPMTGDPPLRPMPVLLRTSVLLI